MSFLFTVGEGPEVPLVVEVTRQAWSMLQTFGEDTEELTDPKAPGIVVDPELQIDDAVNYEAVSTEGFMYGDSGYFYLDQFPEGVGAREMFGFVGFVALHMELLGPDNDDDEQSEVANSQLVFRLETHEAGPAVFTGDTESLTEVTSEEDLTHILRGLHVLSAVAWPQYTANRDSKVHLQPLSDMQSGFLSFLASTGEEQ